MTQIDVSATTPVPAARPAPVTVAYALQLALVGALLVVVVVVVAHAIHYDGLIDRAARTTNVDAALVAGEHAGNLSGALIAAIPAGLLALWLGIAAFGLRRGSNVARILTLVGLGAPLLLGLLACLIGSVGSVLMLGLLVASPDDVVTPEGVPVDDGSAFYDALQRLDSGGWSIAADVVGTIAAAMVVLLGIATGVLLLTRPANRYFAPPPSEPGVSYPYPPYGYPVAPGWPYPPSPAPAPFWYPPPAPPTPPGEPGPGRPATPPDQPPPPPAG